MTKDEALKQALEAWQTSVYGSVSHHKAMMLAMTNVAQALATPVQEPDRGNELTIAYMSGVHRGKELAAQPTTEEYSEVAAPVQEPVGHLLMGPKQDFVTTGTAGDLEINVWHPVYTTPPAALVQEPDYKALYEKASQQYNELAALMEQPPAQPEPVQDAEGENKAVRCFLMLYGQAGLTVGQMRKHMAMSGFKSWPSWVDTEPDGAHLTKAGAQLWIRHLFALEATPPAAQPAPVQEPPDDGFTQALIERDEYHAIADELAEMIARITGEDIGEHTSANFPWRNALDAAENWLCHPPAAQRQWVGLTDEEANELWESTDSDWELMKRTEAKLKEKNT